MSWQPLFHFLGVGCHGELSWCESSSVVAAKLGRGQHVPRPVATVTASASTGTVTLTFSQPVIVSGNIPLNLSGSQTLVSQTITSSTVVTQVYSATVVGDTWSIGSGARRDLSRRDASTR